MYEGVLAFWFEEIEPQKWWSVDPALDELLRQRYAELLQSAMQGELYEWRSSPQGRLAEIIVLDQFSGISIGVPRKRLRKIPLRWCWPRRLLQCGRTCSSARLSASSCSFLTCTVNPG